MSIDTSFQGAEWHSTNLNLDDDEVFNWRPDDTSEDDKFGSGHYTNGNNVSKNEGIIFADDEEEALDQTTSKAYRSSSLKPTEWNEFDEEEEMTANLSELPDTKITHELEKIKEIDKFIMQSR